MLDITHYNINPDTWMEDLSTHTHMKHLFPEFYVSTDTKTMSVIKKISYRTGSLAGKARTFFSKTETKTATLMAYWAADTLVALMLMLTTTSTVAFTVALAMVILHTYATFSVTAEINR